MVFSRAMDLDSIASRRSSLIMMMQTADLWQLPDRAQLWWLNRPGSGVSISNE
jgi:hypothetical protein